jgi:hypothetical protein
MLSVSPLRSEPFFHGNQQEWGGIGETLATSGLLETRRMWLPALA